MSYSSYLNISTDTRPGEAFSMLCDGLNFLVPVREERFADTKEETLLMWVHEAAFSEFGRTIEMDLFGIRSNLSIHIQLGKGINNPLPIEAFGLLMQDQWTQIVDFAITHIKGDAYLKNYDKLGMRRLHGRTTVDPKWWPFTNMKFGFPHHLGELPQP